MASKKHFISILYFYPRGIVSGAFMFSGNFILNAHGKFTTFENNANK